jgi:hypothetical protein
MLVIFKVEYLVNIVFDFINEVYNKENKSY